MLRGDGAGRVPFALVGVLLLVSTGFAAALVASVEREGATQRAHEARLAALVRVSELVHEEVEAQAQQIAIRAIAAGTEGQLNESRIEAAFDVGFGDYVRAHFPRVVRGIQIRVPAFDASVYLMDRRSEDAVFPNATRASLVGGLQLQAPDANAPDAWAPVDVVAYHAVLGVVDYTLAMDGVTVSRQVPMHSVVPAPVPLMATKLEAASHMGLGDFAGVGQTARAILATMVQFRVLSGWASPAMPATTTRDILTTEDVELAVNLALLLEQVRLFRTFDAEAAAALDAARGTLPRIPEGHPPPTVERNLAHLLQAYAANGTLDAGDLYAVCTGLDARGISMAAVLAQSIAAIADQLALRQLDYLGMTPLFDFLNGATDWTLDVLDGFLRWLFDKPSRQAEYTRQYLHLALGDTGVGTDFLGPAVAWIPDRKYAVGGVNVSVAAHAYTVPFPWKDLLSRDYDGLWEAYFPRFNASVARVGSSIRSMVNEFAVRVGNSAVLAGMLDDTASGPVDPKDDVSFLASLRARVLAAVDEALVWMQTEPMALETLMQNLWESIRATLRDLVEHVIASYDSFADAPEVLSAANDALTDDQFGHASQDPEFSRLDQGGRDALRSAIASDVAASGWTSEAYRTRRDEDAARWRAGVDVANGESLRFQLLATVVGDAGWMVLARAMVEGLFREAEAAQDVAGLRVVMRTRLDPFALSGRDGATRYERLRVRQFPSYLATAEGPARERPLPGDLVVEVRDPSTVPASVDTPNVHFTKPTEMTRRPFTTAWSVRVLGAVSLRVETEAAVAPGPGGMRPIALESDWPLNFTFQIPAYSGWPLAGVAYRNSNSFVDDLFNFIVVFLDAAWSVLEPILRPFFDALKQVARALLQLVEPLLRFGRQIIEFLAKITSGLLDFLRTLVTTLVDFLVSILDFFLMLDGSTRAFAVDGHGVRIAFLVNGPEGLRLALGLRTGALDVGIRIVDLVAAGLSSPVGPRWDVVVDWSAAVHPFRMGARLDPATVFEEYMAKASASWAGSWALNAEGPSESRRVFAGRAWESPDLPTPFGTADVEFGVRLIVPADPPDVVLSVLERSYEETVDELGGVPHSLEGLGHFLRRFAGNVLDNAEQAFDEGVELQVYLGFEFKEAMTAGAGFFLSFSVRGRAIREFLTWLGENVMAFLRSGLNPLAPVDSTALPPGVPEQVWIEFTGFLVLETPNVLASLVDGLDLHVRLAASVAANVAAAGALQGMSLGAWAVEFGAWLEVELDGMSVGFFETGALLEIWLMQGSVHAA